MDFDFGGILGDKEKKKKEEELFEPIGLPITGFDFDYGSVLDKDIPGPVKIKKQVYGPEPEPKPKRERPVDWKRQAGVGYNPDIEKIKPAKEFVTKTAKDIFVGAPLMAVSGVSKGISELGQVIERIFNPAKAITNKAFHKESLKQLKEKGVKITKKVIRETDPSINLLDKFSDLIDKNVDMNELGKMYFKGVGHLMTQLPVMGTAISGVSQILPVALEKFATSIGLALYGGVQGIAKEDFKEAVYGTVSGALMGGITKLTNVIKPRFLKMLADGLGFANVDIMSKAIQKGELPNEFKDFFNNETINSFLIGLGMGYTKKRALPKVGEKVPSIENIRVKEIPKTVSYEDILKKPTGEVPKTSILKPVPGFKEPKDVSVERIEPTKEIKSKGMLIEEPVKEIPVKEKIIEPTKEAVGDTSKIIKENMAAFSEIKGEMEETKLSKRLEPEMKKEYEVKHIKEHKQKANKVYNNLKEKGITTKDMIDYFKKKESLNVGDTVVIEKLLGETANKADVSPEYKKQYNKVKEIISSKLQSKKGGEISFLRIFSPELAEMTDDPGLKTYFVEEKINRLVEKSDKFKAKAENIDKATVDIMTKLKSINKNKTPQTLEDITLRLKEVLKKYRIKLDRYEIKKLTDDIVSGDLSKMDIKERLAKVGGLPIVSDKMRKMIKDEQIKINKLEKAYKEKGMPDEKMARKIDTLRTKLAQKIARLVPTTTADKVEVFQTVSMLLARDTILRNIENNFIFSMADRWGFNVLGVPYSKLLSKVTGKPKETTLWTPKESVVGMRMGTKAFANEIVNAFKGIDITKAQVVRLFGGAKGWQELANHLKKQSGANIGSIEQLVGVTGAYNIKGNVCKIEGGKIIKLVKQGHLLKASAKLIESAVGIGEKLLSVVLRGPDRATFWSNYTRSWYNQMKAKGLLKKGEKINMATMSDAPIEVNMNALIEASERIFQDLNKVSALSMKIKQKSPKIFGFNTANLWWKFPLVPANLLRRAYDYTPLGFVHSLYDTAKYIRASNAGKAYYKANRQISRNFSRGVTGTLIASLAFFLKSKGALDDSREDTKRERDFKEKMGRKGFVVCLDKIHRWLEGKATFDSSGRIEDKEGDTWFGLNNYLDQFEPVIKMGVYVFRELQKDVNDNLIKSIFKTKTVGVLAENLLNAGLLTNFRRAGHVFFGSSKYGLLKGDEIIDGTKALVANSLMTFMPRAIESETKSLEEFEKKVYTKNVFETLGNILKVRLGKTKGIENKTDISGEDVRNIKTFWLGCIYPGQIKKMAKVTPEIKYIYKLIDLANKWKGSMKVDENFQASSILPSRVKKVLIELPVSLDKNKRPRKTYFEIGGEVGADTQQYMYKRYMDEIGEMLKDKDFAKLSYEEQHRQVARMVSGVHSETLKYVKNKYFYDNMDDYMKFMRQVLRK